MQRYKPERDDGLKRAIAKFGSAYALAKELGISIQALGEWRRVPAHRILQVEAVTGIDRTELRPDLYK
jgi:DNA-binding transcriptional regulator YdaS (Cro superfamily)